MVLVIIWRTARPPRVLYGNSAAATGGESILVIIVWQRRRPRSLRWPAPRKRLHHGYHVSGDRQDCSHIKSANLKFYQKCYFYFTNSAEFLIHNFKRFLFPWPLICVLFKEQMLSVFCSFSSLPASVILLLPLSHPCQQAWLPWSHPHRNYSLLYSWTN